MVGVPNQPKTPNRTFRSADDPWLLAKEKAKAEGTNITALLNEWLWNYVHSEEEDM